MRIIKKIIIGILVAFGTASLFTTIGILVIVVFFADSPKPLPEKILLRINIDGKVWDGPPKKSILAKQGKLTLRGLIAGLEAAGKDDRVGGLAVYLGGGRLGVAETQEIRDAVTAFRAGGKFAHVFSEDLGGIGGGMSQYYLATAFDEIWLQPSGGVGLIGMAIEMPFARGALEKLDIEPRFGSRHEFKSGAQSITNTALSDPARENLQTLLDSLFGQIVGGIAERRLLEPDAVRALVDNGPYLAEEAAEASLIDQLGYWDEFLDDARTRAGNGAEEVNLGRYAANLEKPENPGPKVALIYGKGAITGDDPDNGPFATPGFGAHQVANAFADAVEDDDIKAILFRIDSPGGSYVASDIVWREVSRAREAGKPVIVSMGGTAASGGYFVAMPADRIVAQPGTVTGSIGVYGGKLVTQKMWERLGVTWDGPHVGRRATMWSFVTDFPPGAEQRFAAMLDFIYDDFTAKAMENRMLTADEIDAVARGRVWSGEDALKVGLVDRLGGYPAAIAEVKQALEVAEDEEIDLVLWPKPLEPIERLMMALGGDSPYAGVTALLDPGAEQGLDRLARDLEPLVGDISAFTRPQGVMQMPPLRLRY